MFYSCGFSWHCRVNPYTRHKRENSYIIYSLEFIIINGRAAHDQALANPVSPLSKIPTPLPSQIVLYTCSHVLFTCWFVLYTMLVCFIVCVLCVLYASLACFLSRVLPYDLYRTLILQMQRVLLSQLQDSAQEVWTCARAFPMSLLGLS